VPDETFEESAKGLVGRKDDDSKTRYDLIPAGALDAVARVLTYGAAKYGDDNWRRVEPWDRRYFGAAMRHLWAWWRGERLDSDTQLSHLAHAACCIFFLFERERDDA